MEVAVINAERKGAAGSNDVYVEFSAGRISLSTRYPMVVIFQWEFIFVRHYVRMYCRLRLLFQWENLTACFSSLVAQVPGWVLTIPLSLQPPSYICIA